MSDSMRESVGSMHSEALLPRDSVESLGSLLRGVMGEHVSSRLSANQRAMVAWYGSNGDRERAHTTRVFLRQAKVRGADPIICVYVDSHSYLTDLTANRDIYLARLANWGFMVSGIEFGVDRELHRHKGGGLLDDAWSGGEARKSVQPSERLVSEVDDMVENVPESLKEKVSRAIIASKMSNGEK